HPSADRAILKTALTRGSFEFQGQKCSASSRARWASEHPRCARVLRSRSAGARRDAARPTH
ncbi:hypothetical protein, partial [Streptomyces sp. NPDC093600]|uniref:hypothetical protein n=1 Tax=Streptomyces sp. NPDC093600 TaxID=3366047 RepID=UPI0037F8FEA1